MRTIDHSGVGFYKFAWTFVSRPYSGLLLSPASPASANSPRHEAFFLCLTNLLLISDNAGQRLREKALSVRVLGKIASKCAPRDASKALRNAMEILNRLSDTDFSTQ